MKSIILNISIILLLTSVTSVFGQQEAQYTHFMVNPYLYNPALSGAEDYWDIKGGYRNQWTGIEGAPTTFYLGAHGPVSKHHIDHAKGDKDGRRHSLGGLVASDKAGDIRFNLAYVSYSYTVTLAKGVFFGVNNHKRGIELSLGTFLGAKQYQLSLTGVDDLASLDIPIDLENINKIIPDGSIGAWLHFGDYTYAGLSIQQLFRNQVASSSRLSQHYNFVAGSEFLIADELKVLPSVLIKKVIGAPFSYDLNTRFDYQEAYYLGASYRSGDALSFLAGLVIQDKYEIAYSYDFLLSNLRTSSLGGHEIILGLRLHPRLNYRNPTW